jgi:hypothetical protein
MDDPIGVGIREAFRAVDLDCELIAVPDMPDGSIFIWVSHRAYSPD